jgi:type II secretory pathway predicted ATPase ExeA
MYYDYWGLKKPAFDNVPDPSMYVDCHASMENAIAEALFAIQEGDECIAVIVGDVGLGKTMSLRMIIDSLDQEKYRMALITNPGISFGQILQEIIGQLTGEQCKEKRKVNLLEMFNRLLFSTIEEGKKILIFIDEANAMTPMNLESLRLLTNMQEDRRNLFTMVLAGQIEFARRLEHPKRANLFQRVGTYSRIDKLESMEKVRQYVETRLKLAGATKTIFADDAFESLWEHSGHGIPRLVNKLSKLCLKAGETNRYEYITGEMVGQIGDRFHKLTGPAVEKRKARKSVSPEVQPEALEASAGDLELPENVTEADPSGTENEETALISREISPTEEKDQGEKLPDDGAAPGPISLVPAAPLPEEPQPHLPPMDSEAEMCIGQVKIKIHFPTHLMKQSCSASQEHRFKLAGGLAAETLKRYPDLMASPSADPVPIWLEIRDFVLDRMTHAGRM